MSRLMRRTSLRIFGGNLNLGALVEEDDRVIYAPSESRMVMNVSPPGKPLLAKAVHVPFAASNDGGKASVPSIFSCAMIALTIRVAWASVNVGPADADPGDHRKRLSNPNANILI